MEEAGVAGEGPMGKTMQIPHKNETWPLTLSSAFLLWGSTATHDWPASVTQTLL